MIRSLFGRLMWVGRATSAVVGLAVVLALVVGVSSAALAGNLDPLKIGSLKNVATKTTALVGKVASGSAFAVKNPSGGSALDLQVNAGQAPLTVSAEAGKATNLSADELDGKDSSEFAAGVDGKATDASNADKLGGIGSNGFIQGTGKVIGNRVEYPVNSGNGTVLDVPGLGTVEASCGNGNMRLGFRNRSEGTVTVFRDDGGNDPQSDALGSWGFVYLNFDKAGNELVTLQLLGPNQRLATITVTGRAPSSAPCLFEAQGIVQGA